MGKFNKRLIDIKNSTGYDSKSIRIKKASNVRIKAELKKWRNAIHYAEQPVPDYREWVKLCKEIAIDSSVLGSKNIRNSNIISKCFKDENLTEEQYNFVNSNTLYKFINFVLESIYTGYSIIEIGDQLFENEFEIEALPLENVYPAKKSVILDPSKIGDDNLIDITQPEYSKTYLFISNCKSDSYLGLYNACMPNFIYKKDIYNQMYQFIEKFGTPQVIVKTMMNDEEYLKGLESYLNDFKNSSYAIIGSNDEITLAETSNQGVDIFINSIKIYEEAIKEIITGSKSSGSEQAFVGSAEVSAEYTSAISKSDMKFVLDSINNKLIPLLAERGLTYLKNLKLEFEEVEEIDINKQNFIINLINTGKYTIPAKYLAETFDIEILDNEIDTTEENVQKQDKNTEE